MQWNAWGLCHSIYATRHNPHVPYASTCDVSVCMAGHCFSRKYVSKAKKFNPCHCIVFSNAFPDSTKFSQDRLQVIDLAQEQNLATGCTTSTTNTQQPGPDLQHAPTPTPTAQNGGPQATTAPQPGPLHPEPQPRSPLSRVFDSVGGHGGDPTNSQSGVGIANHLQQRAESLGSSDHPANLSRKSSSSSDSSDSESAESLFDSDEEDENGVTYREYKEHRDQKRAHGGGAQLVGESPAATVTAPATQQLQAATAAAAAQQPKLKGTAAAAQQAQGAVAAAPAPATQQPPHPELPTNHKRRSCDGGQKPTTHGEQLVNEHQPKRHRTIKKPARYSD